MAYRSFDRGERSFGEFTAPIRHILLIHKVTIKSKKLFVNLHRTLTICVDKSYEGTHLAFGGTLALRCHFNTNERDRLGDPDNYVFSSQCQSINATCSSSFSELLITEGQRGEKWGTWNTSDTLSDVEADEVSQINLKCPVVIAGCNSLRAFNTEFNQAQIDFPPRTVCPH